MPSEKVAKILRAKSNLTDEKITAMTEREAWAWIYSQRPPKTEEKLDQICFTGFDQTIRALLELKAREAHLEVVKSVTKNLRYLCAGANAGPSKLKKAKQLHVTLMSAEQFENMIGTGELPVD